MLVYPIIIIIIIIIINIDIIIIIIISSNIHCILLTRSSEAYCSALPSCLTATFVYPSIYLSLSLSLYIYIYREEWLILGIT